MIVEAREAFARRAEGSEAGDRLLRARRRPPADGAVAAQRQPDRWPAASGGARDDVERSETARAGEDMVVLLVRALGGEADKLAMFAAR